MDLLQLKYFVRVAEQGNFTDASIQLGITQPTISRKVRALEVELRTALFHRNGRGVQLTAAGRRFFDHARGVLRGIDAAVLTMREGEPDYGGRIIGGLPPSVGNILTPPLVAAFAEKFPHASLSIVEGSSYGLYGQLLSGRLDFAVLRNPATTSHLSVDPVMTEALYLVGAKPLPQCSDSVALADLVDLALILPSAPHSIRSLVDAVMARAGISLNVTFEVDAVGSLIKLAATGLGYTMLSESTLRTIPDNVPLWCCRINAPELSTTLALAMPSRQPRGQLPMAVVALARELLSIEFDLNKTEQAKRHQARNF